LDGFDPRTTLARDDLADQALEGVVRAARYQAVEPMQAAVTSAALHRGPDAASEQLNTIIFGEAFDVLDRKGDWVWGRVRRDGYVGWLHAHALAAPVLAPTHRVSALSTLAFPEPDIKTGPPTLLALNSLVSEEARQGRFVKLARAGWVADIHLADLNSFDTDPVAVAERYLGAPYRWGGRESTGVDCSGLVQQALYACGRACPRDADMQELQTGKAIDTGPRFANLRRGDLVFWTDHVALMVDATRVVHATSHHMGVAIEPLADAVARVGEPTTFRRL
jgi:cell wall-associated NlpC family hydrolase